MFFVTSRLLVRKRRRKLRERLSPVLGGCEELPDDLVTIATGIRETGAGEFGVMWTEEG